MVTGKWSENLPFILFQTKLSYVDICRHMEAWSEIFFISVTIKAFQLVNGDDQIR